MNYIYLLTPNGIREKTSLTLSFMKRKIKEYDELKAELKKDKQNMWVIFKYKTNNYNLFQKNLKKKLVFNYQTARESCFKRFSIDKSANGNA